MPSGCGPTWLTATESAIVPTAPSTMYFQFAGRRPSAGMAAHPSGATATITDRKTDGEEGAQQGQHLVERHKLQHDEANGRQSRDETAGATIPESGDNPYYSNS